MLSLSIELVFKSEVVSNHRDKFAVGGLSSVVLNGVAKIRIKRIHVASVPRDLNGVSDCTLDAACGGLVFLCHRGIEYLCDTVDYIAVIYGKQDRRAEILISLNMRGHTYLVDYFGNLSLYVRSSTLLCLFKCNNIMISISNKSIYVLAKAFYVIWL